MKPKYVDCDVCGKKVFWTQPKCPYCGNANEKIISNYLEYNPSNKQHKPDSLYYGWAWYIIIMAISLFFKEWYLGWIAATYIFFSWRKQQIKEYNNGESVWKQIH